MGYRIINGKLYSVEGGFQNVSSSSKANKKEKNFSEVLKNQIDKKEGFVISNHAMQRLEDRKIVFNESDMNKINEGIDEAAKRSKRGYNSLQGCYINNKY